MSKLEELIQKYCPDGVEYVRLEKVCNFMSGFAFKASLFFKEGEPICKTTNIQDDAIDFSNMECFHLDDYDTNLDRYIINPQDIVIGMSGTIKVGINNSNKKCYLNQRVGKFSPNEKVLNNRFLFYILLNSIDALCEGITGGSVKNLSTNDINSLEIPVPPLPVQEEIVRILDTFTELQAELQAELQKRLQQYNYYRDNLLSFEGRTDVEWMTIEQLFHRKNGYTPSKSNVEFWTNGTIPWFRMEDVRENGRILTDSIQKVHPSAVKKNSLVKAGSIIVATSATIGEHALVMIDCLTNQRFTCLSIKDEHKTKVSVKFLFYYMFKVDEWCKTHTVQGNFPGVDMSQFPYVSIPIPSLAEQQRIVDILDRFDSLTNDLTSGLPAEIEKRRRQYEYYRDKLLTFKRKES